jgi:hypothetical protein
MVSEFGAALAAVAGILALFGGIALLVWVEARSKVRERELAHAERIKALETGQPLPDAEVARCRAEASRAWAAGMTTTFVALGMAGAAVGATALVFQFVESTTQLPYFCVAWGVCGLVGLVAVSHGFRSMRRREGVRGGSGQPGEATRHAAERSAEAIRMADTPAGVGR